MADTTFNLLALPPRSLPAFTAEQDLALRRRLAGRRGFRPDDSPPTRTTDGEWMWRTTLDLPEAMQLELEALSDAHGVTVDQLVREALVGFGIGQALHVVGIRDGTYSDDKARAEREARANGDAAALAPRPPRPGNGR